MREQFNESGIPNVLIQQKKKKIQKKPCKIKEFQKLREKQKMWQRVTEPILPRVLL